MTSQTLRILVAGMALWASAATAFAQETPAPAAPAPAPAPTETTIKTKTREKRGSLPAVGEILTAVESASTGEGGGADDWSTPVKLAVVFIALALLPSLLVMMTSFTWIVIVLGFVRRALTTQAIPPNVAIIGLAIFLTLFTMSGTFERINTEALQPYLQNQLTFADACSRGNHLLKVFMLRQTRPSDLKLFVDLAGVKVPDKAVDLPSYVTIPAFAISEFYRAFQMGCMLFIPFLLVDLVIASILLSAGMMMLPPAIVSLPFKLILFVLVDGWHMLALTLVKSFQ